MFQFTCCFPVALPFHWLQGDAVLEQLGGSFSCFLNPSQVFFCVLSQTYMLRSILMIALFIWAKLFLSDPSLYLFYNSCQYKLLLFHSSSGDWVLYLSLYLNGTNVTGVSRVNLINVLEAEMTVPSPSLLARLVVSFSSPEEHYWLQYEALGMLGRCHLKHTSVLQWDY